MDEERFWGVIATRFTGVVALVKIVWAPFAGRLGLGVISLAGLL